MSGPQSEKVKKELQVFFTEVGLNCMYWDNCRLLGITLNLLDGTCKPHQEPENTITLQTSSNKFQLQSKHVFPAAHQMKQFYNIKLQ